jgi:hypothetical protein
VDRQFGSFNFHLYDSRAHLPRRSQTDDEEADDVNWEWWVPELQRVTNDLGYRADDDDLEAGWRGEAEVGVAAVTRLLRDETNPPCRTRACR